MLICGYRAKTQFLIKLYGSLIAQKTRQGQTSVSSDCARHQLSHDTLTDSSLLMCWAQE
jgi:hypothetical protein